MAEVHRVPRRSMLASLSLLVSVIVAGVAVGSGFGTRFGLWGFRTGLTILKWSVLAACVTGVSSLIAVWITLPLRSDTRGFTLSLIALGISFMVVAIPIRWKLRARTAPPIHDITTDLNNPPKIRVLQKFRRAEHNDLNRSNPELASLQQKYYPELESLYLQGSKFDCMKKVVETARTLNWLLRAVNWQDGHVEATDQTFWFGFRDDVVVRVEMIENDQCKVDVRSVSRYGKSDLGTNARRIRNFFKGLKST
jgi:uncharacterized protein (DUF1499 family)